MEIDTRWQAYPPTPRPSSKRARWKDRRFLWSLLRWCCYLPFRIGHPIVTIGTFIWRRYQIPENQVNSRGANVLSKLKPKTCSTLNPGDLQKVNLRHFGFENFQQNCSYTSKFLPTSTLVTSRCCCVRKITCMLTQTSIVT